MIALCTLLDDRKQRCIERLLPRWNELDLGADEAVWYVAANDAGEALCERFRATARHEVIFLTTPLDDIRLPTPEEYARLDTCTHTSHLRKIARLREAVRVTASGFYPQADRGAEWLFWLDADIDPGRNAVRHLRQVLESTDGPLRPRVASGLYCDRRQGAPIAQEWGGYRLAQLAPGRVQAVGFMGFGCLLMDRETARAVSWTGYDQAAAARLEHQRRRGIKPRGVGEDVYWLRLCQNRFGVPLFVDTRVLCRHYHEDGGYWTYIQVDGRLETHYVRSEEAAGKTRLVYAGTGPYRLPGTDRRIEPGEAFDLSPELAAVLRRRDRRFVPAAYHETITRLRAVAGEPA